MFIMTSDNLYHNVGSTRSCKQEVMINSYNALKNLYEDRKFKQTEIIQKAIDTMVSKGETKQELSGYHFVYIFITERLSVDKLSVGEDGLSRTKLYSGRCLDKFGWHASLGGIC